MAKEERRTNDRQGAARVDATERLELGAVIEYGLVKEMRDQIEIDGPEKRREVIESDLDPWQRSLLRHRRFLALAVDGRRDLSPEVRMREGNSSLSLSLSLSPSSVSLRLCLIKRIVNA